MEHDWKSASNKIVQRKEIDLFMQYHDSEMIHGK
jgi:ribosomal protein S24E